MENEVCIWCWNTILLVSLIVGITQMFLFPNPLVKYFGLITWAFVVIIMVFLLGKKRF